MNRSPDGRAIEPKEGSILIGSFQILITDDLRRDGGECDAVAAKAQGKRSTRHVISGPDTRQPIARLAEGSCPGVGHFEFNLWKAGTKSLEQRCSLALDETVATVIVGERCVFPADHYALVRCKSKIEVGSRRFPDHAALGPVGEIVDRFTHQNIGAVEVAYAALEISLRLVAGGEDDMLRGDLVVWIDVQVHLAGRRLDLRDERTILDPRSAAHRIADDGVCKRVWIDCSVALRKNRARSLD